MRRWIELAAKLYPVKWRERYGMEFHALLEDLNPGWREFLNVLGGALKMQLSTSGALYLKLGAVFAIFGMLAAFAVSFTSSREYASTAVLRVEPGSEQPLASATQQVTSRVNLAELMQRKDLILYVSERSEMPLEDVVGKMASNLKIELIRTKDSAMALRVEYRYQDARKAQAVVNAIVGELSAFLAYRQKGRSEIAVLEKASLPLEPVNPYRAKFLMTGLVGGLILGILTALTIRQTRRTLLVASVSAAGLLLGAGASLLVPNRYISTAVIRVVPGDGANPADATRWLQQAATTLIDSQKLANRRDLTLQLAGPQKMPLASSVGTAAMIITSEHQDPHRAQAMVQAAMLQLMEQNRSVSESTGSTNKIEVLDNASLPESPSFPNRMVISLIGLAAGLLLGLTLLWAMRRSVEEFPIGRNFPIAPPSSRC